MHIFRKVVQETGQLMQTNPNSTARLISMAKQQILQPGSIFCERQENVFPSMEEICAHSGLGPAHDDTDDNHDETTQT